MNRREFMIAVAGGAFAVMAGEGLTGEAWGRGPAPAAGRGRSRVALIKTGDRAAGIKRAIRLLGVNPVAGKRVLLKPNFNTADPFPASTHNDTLIHLIAELREMGAKTITIGERSGPPDTGDVLREKGIYELCRRLDAGLVNFEELPPEGWVKVSPPGNHWRNGFLVAKPVLDAECVVTTCCLKTHGYGGVFTMSLKLSVGITHKSNMRELHTSFLSQRKMIAEINQAYAPALILLDGIEAFVDGGPSKGPKKKADVILAGTDRIAIDAVGLALLKELGSNREIMEKRIFAQEQIARAVELGLGVRSAGEIEIVADDQPGERYAEKVRQILAKG
ncbi:DUF362 domain-containing protein [Geobacter sp.]|uniref:DUF362 domain-containing protein n=1 Tax=Geobacter sp. TaxID=46610 RepID=UPI00262AE004|nr:DUF362 domain-containing protein [Geobacter sp.]